MNNDPKFDGIRGQLKRFRLQLLLGEHVEKSWKPVSDFIGLQHDIRAHRNRNLAARRDPRVPTLGNCRRRFGFASTQQEASEKSGSQHRQHGHTTREPMNLKLSGNGESPKISRKSKFHLVAPTGHHPGLPEVSFTWTLAGKLMTLFTRNPLKASNTLWILWFRSTG